MSEDEVMKLFILGVFGGLLYIIKLIYSFSKWTLDTYAKHYIKEKHNKD